MKLRHNKASIHPILSANIISALFGGAILIAPSFICAQSVESRLYSINQLSFVPPSYPAIIAKRDRLTGASFSPIATIEIGYEFKEKFIGKAPDHPSDCRGKTGDILIKYIQSEIGEFGGYKPLEYRGASVSCQPNGFGIMTYANGAMWIGEVTAQDTRISQNGGNTTGWGTIALPVGEGLLVTNPNSTFPIDIRKLSVQKQNNKTPWANTLQLMERQNSRDGWVRFMATPRPTGPATYKFSDGGQFFSILNDGITERDPAGNKYIASDGTEIIGNLIGINSQGPMFNIINSMRLKSAKNGLPKGIYDINYRHMFADNLAVERNAVGVPEDERKYLPISVLLDTTKRKYYFADFAKAPEMLREPISNVWNCPNPPVLPDGWVVWWPGCGNTQSLSIYSPDAKQAIHYSFSNTENSALYTDRRNSKMGDFVKAENFTWSRENGLRAINPAPKNQFHDGVKYVMFTGSLNGVQPNGIGNCEYTKRNNGQSKDIIEPCEWQNGRRVDAIYQTDLRLFEAQKRADRLAAEATEKLRLAKEEEARVIAEYQRQRDQEAERQRIAQERREAQQRAREEEQRRQARNRAIVDALNQVGQSAAQSIYETGRQQQITNGQINAARQSQQYGRYVPPPPPPPTYQEMQRMEEIRRQYGTVYGSSAAQERANNQIQRDRLRAADDARVRRAREAETKARADAEFAKIEADRIRISAESDREAELRAHEARASEARAIADREAATRATTQAENQSRERQRQSDLEQQREEEKRRAADRAEAVRLEAELQRVRTAQQNERRRVEATANQRPVQILTWRKAGGWRVGDRGSLQTSEGISVTFEIQDLTIRDPNRIYVVGEFTNNGSGMWCGGQRITPNYPDRTHASLRLGPYSSKKWGEAMAVGVQEIYIAVQVNSNNCN